MKTKRCWKCKRELPATQEFFHRDSVKKSGLQGMCKECCSAYDTARYWDNREENILRVKKYNEDNRERVLARKKAYRESHSAEIAEKRKAYYETHRKKENAQCQAYHADHLENINTRHREYLKEHPDKVREYKRRRYVRKHNVLVEQLPPNYEELLYESQGGRCWWCKKRLNGKYHVDHRFPLSKGGAHRMNNLVLACPTCNLSKGAKLPSEFCGRLV